MAVSLLQTLFFPPPSSVYVTAMSVVSFVSLANAGYMEMKGKNVQYSKFLNVAGLKNMKDEKIKWASRKGMLLCYTPSLLVGLASYAIFPYQDLRFLVLVSVLTIHFLKRVLEALLVHKYSGSMVLEAAITISISYTISTMTMIYAQYLSQEFHEPAIDLKYIGTTLFLIGIVGNFYHHNILSNLRKKGDGEYKIPKGGLFDLVVCPHYLFEIVELLGFSCISQTPYTFCFLLGTTLYLIGRSYATREWYLSKFGEKFSKDVKAMIPYIF